MSYIVYHESFSPEFILDEESYFEYLSTGEWFDRPQVNQKGNRDETEQLLNGFKESKESRQHGLPEYERKILQHSRHKEREIEASAASKDRISEGEANQVVRRRGRPKINK